MAYRRALKPINHVGISMAMALVFLGPIGGLHGTLIHALARPRVTPGGGHVPPSARTPACADHPTGSTGRRRDDEVVSRAPARKPVRETSGRLADGVVVLWPEWVRRIARSPDADHGASASPGVATAGEAAPPSLRRQGDLQVGEVEGLG